MLKAALLCVSISVFVQGCASVAPDGKHWEAPLNQNHELVGAVWDVRNSRLVTVPALLQSLSQAQYAILGEKHDNPDHHHLQAFVLQQLRNEGSLSSVSFEMLDSSQSEALFSVSPSALSSMAALKAHLNWDEDGWDWNYYGPMLYESLRAGELVLAANINSDELMAIYGGAESEAIKGLLDEAKMRRLEQEIDESHCGLLPQSQFAAMIRVQRSRDAQMATSLQNGAREGQGVQVLIAGNFHARRDLGVPNYLPQGASLVSLSFIELGEQSTDPLDYVEALGAEQVYDYLWFTPSMEPQDYCAELRAGDGQ